MAVRCHNSNGLMYLLLGPKSTKQTYVHRLCFPGSIVANGFLVRAMWPKTYMCMFSWFLEKHADVCFSVPQPLEALCSPAGHMALLPAAQDVHMRASGHPVHPLAGAHRQPGAPATKRLTHVPLP